MNEEQKDEVLELINDVEDVLELDDSYLKEMMESEPEALITLLREGYTILHTILVESLNQNDEL